MEVGYSKTISTTVTDSWTSQLGFSLGKLSGSMSFTKTIQHYASQSWSTKTTTTETVDVPPHSKGFFHQRVFKVHLELESAPQVCMSVPPPHKGAQPRVPPVQFSGARQPTLATPPLVQIKIDGNKGPEEVTVLPHHKPPQVHFNNPYGGPSCNW